MIYYDSRCPQCHEDEEKQQFEKMIEPLKRAEKKRQAQKQLRLIMTELEKATLLKETTHYKRSVCPYCGHPSLFFSNATGYECHNKDCGLTSSIRYYTENSNG
jgi:RNA polymerase subunit RPABC4/transcription elongation factor Spt4